MRFESVLTLCMAATAIQAQTPTLSSWSDTSIDVAFKLAIPEKTAAPFPIMMSITAPANVTWAAFATGACMLRSPLIVAWPNGTGVVVTARWAT